MTLVAAPCFWLALRARSLPALPEQDLDEHDERRDRALPEQDLDEHDERRDRGNEEGGEAP